MDNENEKAVSYYITVRIFNPLFSYKKNPPQGTKVYGTLEANTVVYTFPASIASPNYSIERLVFYGSDYWVRFKNLGSNKVNGYVKCSDISFDFKTYAAPEVQTPNSEIGSNPSVIFNMWYFPVSGYTGVNYPAPLYYQYYYLSGNPDPQNSMKCTLLSSISGDYMYVGRTMHPNNYLGTMTDKYWHNGMIWIAKMSRTSTKDSIMAKAKSNLNSHKPFLVGAQNSETEHMVLVTGYKNSGTNLSDYIVLDSSQKYFSDLDTFLNLFRIR